MGIAWRAGEEDITLYGRRKDAKEGVVDVFPDKAERSGVREGRVRCGGDEYILDAARCTHNVRGPPTESTRKLIGQLIPPRAKFPCVLGQVKTAGGSVTYGWSAFGPRSVSS